MSTPLISEQLMIIWIIINVSSVSLCIALYFPYMSNHQTDEVGVMSERNTNVKTPILSEPSPLSFHPATFVVATVKTPLEHIE
jgi:hypothetical protein